MVDGKAMWCLLDYYFRKELKCSCSLKVVTIFIVVFYFSFYRFVLLFYFHFICADRIWRIQQKNHQLCQFVIIQMRFTTSYYHRNWVHCWEISQRYILTFTLDSINGSKRTKNSEHLKEKLQKYNIRSIKFMLTKFCGYLHQIHSYGNSICMLRNL